jgi:RNA polymerase sigma factor (sigma-70 family)
MSPKSAIAEIYRSEHQRMLAFLAKKVTSREEAEDILQEVFAKAVEAPNVLSGVENLLAWLYTVARNRVIDRYRKRGRRPRDVSFDETTIDDLLHDAGVSLEDSFVRGLAAEAIEDSIAELPPEQRWVFCAQAIEGRTFRELAEETGLSINTLSARKRYAVFFLKRRLKTLKGIIDDGGLL